MSDKSVEKSTDEKIFEERLSSVALINTFTSLPPELEDSIIDLTGPIQMEAYSIRQEEPIDWSSYAEQNIISEDDCNFIHSFQSAKTKKERDTIIHSFQVLFTFLNIVP
nr:probable V-type proton ATPase subunit H 2 [Parasteatoda tepidariorum]